MEYQLVQNRPGITAFKFAAVPDRDKYHVSSFLNLSGGPRQWPRVLRLRKLNEGQPNTRHKKRAVFCVPCSIMLSNLSAFDLLVEMPCAVESPKQLVNLRDGVYCRPSF
jgi:hypothetical protein